MSSPLDLQHNGHIMFPEEFVTDERYIEPTSIIPIINTQISQILTLKEWGCFPVAMKMLKDLQNI